MAQDDFDSMDELAFLSREEDPLENPIEGSTKSKIESKPTKSNIDFRLGEYHFDKCKSDYWDFYVKTNINYVIEYDGLRSVIHKQLIRGLNSLYNRALKSTWETSYLDAVSRDRVFREYNSQWDYSERWWDLRKNIWDYYPSDKGGQQTKIVTIGETYDVMDFGPLVLSNEGRLAWEGWKFSVSPDQNIYRNILVPYQVVQPKKYSFGISPPSGNICAGSCWSLSGRVNLNIKLTELQNNSSGISLNLKFKHYTAIKKIPWFEANIQGRISPFKNQYDIQVTVFFLQF